MGSISLGCFLRQRKTKGKQGLIASLVAVGNMWYLDPPPLLPPKGWGLGFCRETGGTPQKRALQNEILGGTPHYKIRT